MILGGSGISFLADCFAKPYLYLNSASFISYVSDRCITIPALVYNSNGISLTFRQQITLYESLADHGEERFPEGRLSARNASGDEICAALEEDRRVAKG